MVLENKNSNFAFDFKETYFKMNITKENIDALNAVIKIDIVAKDYNDKVTSLLINYRKTASVPGFRKGQVPMGMIKKQYGKKIVMDEVNKVLKESLDKYLAKEKLNILGNPIPKIQDDFSWDTEDFSFEFELGLAPEFEVSLESEKKVTRYNIVANDELLEKEVENIQSRYGKAIAKEVATEIANVTGTFVNEEKEINKKGTISVKDIKGEANLKKFVGAKIGDVLTLETKGLFENDHTLQGVLGLSNEDVQGLEIVLTFTVEEVTETELAELNQELFDKLFADGSVKTVADLKSKIKEDAEKQFQQQGDQQLLNAVTQHLVETTKFDLPSAFLQKWLQTAGEKQLTEEEAVAEFAKSEKGLRYQLIEGKVMRDNNIQLDYKELVDYTKGFVKSQMAQFGNMNPEDKELNEIVGRVLGNQEEAKRLQEQLISQKLLTFYKDNLSFDTKELSYEEFIKEVYK